MLSISGAVRTLIADRRNYEEAVVRCVGTLVGLIINEVMNRISDWLQSSDAMGFHFTLSVPLASFNAVESVACLQRVTGTLRFHI